MNTPPSLFRASRPGRAIGSCRLRLASAKLAAALLLASGLGASAALAQATWVGDTGQDWNAAANWSTDPANPTGNFTVNTAADGVFPILAADSAFTPVDLLLADGGVNSARFDHRSGSISLAVITASGNWAFVARGANTATATYNLADTSATDAGVSGFAQGSGSLTVGKFFVGGGYYANGGVGTANINTTGAITANSTQNFSGQGNASIALGVGAGSSGTLNLQSGTIAAAGQFWVGNKGDGAVNQTGGTVNVGNILLLARNNTNTEVGDGAWTVSGAGVVNIEADLVVAHRGAADAQGVFTINTGATVNVATTIKRWLIVNQLDSARGTLNVNGGALNLNTNTDLRFSTGGGTGASVVNLSGGAITFHGGNNNGAPGTGVVDLNYGGGAAANNTFNLDGGILTTAQIITNNNNGAATFNFNGGVLKASNTGANFIDLGGAGQTAVVKSGGALIDSNGFDLTIPQPLIADGVSAGGLTKTGSGTLTLAGVNTYVGDTTINNGSLTLADNASLKFLIGATGVNNKVTGAGTFTVDGDFVFDLAGAGTTVGDSWQIVDVSTLTETFGGTFSVPGFGLSEGKWVRPVDTIFYEFDPATGLLRVISDPDFVYPPPSITLGNYNTSYAIGSDIVLSVSASGLGELTYQWYYQADAGATPTAIVDATASTLTVSAAMAENGGIYSVIVTDHAAEDSGQAATTATATFSAISVVPASELAVAYYRFEEGENASVITSALDSVGDSNLTAPLGAPAYTSNVPYATIPASGDANVLGANFPASGNNGLVAPTSGTLADTALNDFTIEAFVRFSDLTGTQTVVGRDDVTTGSGTGGQGAGDQALFYLQKNAANQFRVELITKANTNIQINSQSTATLGAWYHVAAVGNAITGTLKLYVNGTEVGSVAGFNGLFVPTAGSDTPWTVGRGDWRLGDADFLRGDIDEVRVTRAVLPPSQFLNSANGVALVPPTASITPNYTSVYPGADVLFTATATSNMAGGTLTYQWYKDGDLLGGETGLTLSRSSVTLDDNGVYSFVVTDTVNGSSLTTTVTARLRVLDIPAAGARAIGLNFVGAGSGNWSAELGTLAASQSAGVYPMINWNNSASVTGVAVQSTPLALNESDGLSTAAITATWNSVGAWSARTGTGAPSEKTPDVLLLHGYIESRLAAGSTVTVSNIPYASYDVYVHVAGGGTTNQVGSLRINREGAPIYYYRVFQNDALNTPYTFPVAMGESLTRTDALATPPATFVRFTGVTGADLTITAIDSVLNQNAGGIAAIQIVDRTPAGAAYPVVVSRAPASKLVQGGADVGFAVTAASQNGGTLTYQWKKGEDNLPGQTSATLALSNLTGADSGDYTVVITDTSSLGVSTTTRAASLVVVDGTRSLLINGDLNTAASPTYVGNGILRADGASSHENLEPASTVWNGVVGAAGTATRVLAKESTGLALPGVTFTYAGATGAESNTALGGIAGTVAEELEQDYLFAAFDSTAPLTGTVGGLQALAGKEVTLLVYAIGKTTKTFAAVSSATVNDTANVSLATANNHLGSPTATTTVFGIGGEDDAGRNIEFNSPTYNGGLSTGHVAFTGVVAADGTVAWSLTPDTSVNGGGLVPLVGFQLLVTATDIAPPVPAGLAAVAATGQVNLSWNASSGAQTYTVKRATAAEGPYSTISAGAITGTSYSDASVLDGTTYHYVVAAANSLAQSADSSPVSVTTSGVAPGLPQWRLDNFGSADNTGDAANSADPDADGIPNLLEYALGTDPTAGNTSPVVAGRDGEFLTLAFDHVGDATLVYSIEASNDLSGAWTTVHTYPAFTTAGAETHTDTVALGSATRRFLRLRVTLAE